MEGAKRLLKRRGRHTKLLHLKLSAFGCVPWCGSARSGTAEAPHSQLARHGGSQKGGNVDIVYDQCPKLQDPKGYCNRTTTRSCSFVDLQTGHQLSEGAHVRLEGDLDAAYYWMVVAGPMAALQVYLMDMGWDASALDDCQGILPAVQPIFAEAAASEATESKTHLRAGALFPDHAAT